VPAWHAVFSGSRAFRPNDPGARLKHDTSLALYAYWERCRRTSGIRASGIRAAELAAILPSLFLLDLPPSGSFRFRFCGAALATRYGRDLCEEGFLPLWNADDRTTLEPNLRFIAARSAGLVAGIMAETVGGGFTAFEMLLLPLAGENGAAGAIGSMVRIGGHEEANRIRARIVGQWLRSIRFLPAQEPARPARVPGAYMVPAPPPGGGRRYRHLTVVSGGK
jgi:hypothetical protein